MEEKNVCFTKIANEIYLNRSEYEKKIKDLFVKTEICSIEEFCNSYKEEIRGINSEITPSKDQPTIADFKEIFQTFDKYPSNLQKPKKHVSKDLNRTMAVSRTQSTTEIIGDSNCGAPSPKAIVHKPGSTASEIYSGFRDFKQSLNKVLEEQKETELQRSYLHKLQKLNTWGKDIEKLYGTECCDLQEALSKEDAAKLHQFANNLENGLFINENRNLFQEEGCLNQQPNGNNFENVLDLLSYWLNSVGHYKET